MFADTFGNMFALAEFCYDRNDRHKIRQRPAIAPDPRFGRLLSAADPNAFGPYGTYLVFDPLSLEPDSPVLDLLGVRVLAADARRDAAYPKWQ